MVKIREQHYGTYQRNCIKVLNLGEEAYCITSLVKILNTFDSFLSTEFLKPMCA